MPDEPENLVLVQLREIRGELHDIKSKQREHHSRFDALDRRFDEMRGYALGLGTMNDLKQRELDARLEAVAAEWRRRDEQWAEVERRISTIEDRPDR